MKRDSRISRLSEAFGSIDNLWRIIGNISNLQERAVRWYFNDAKFEQGQEQLDADKLKNVLIRALKYLRSDDKKMVCFSETNHSIFRTVRRCFGCARSP